MNTLLEYLYRDASNYKQHGRVVLQGVISLSSIRHLLFDKTYFIPSQVGLPDLQHKFQEQGFEYPTDDDQDAGSSGSELMRELKMSSGAISKLVAKGRIQAQALLGR
ncbi:MAG: hypothetical protein A2X28_04030 [Elusimicrobia bacterium GWA2_56_46]|jgi:hypothetical protein|nr:MAG: hypothetical protein A2X28_04030 [Elusimicrobia bacterium GWA2_56_46]OGR56048.1 MAG: hypothetical protein A2X39_07450 [Elusimicrobia bacterium GWC2_56_31]HBB67911.1 hypothetical protein [Elusimicrobiota bacterium]HBW22878.1 hypothetical protein [Elusimicrobiota bacterium]